MDIVLASASPYRQALLARLGLAFAVHQPDVDESPLPYETAPALAARLARAKAHAAAAHHPGALIIGSDQTAAHGGTLLSKPGNAANAVAQLRTLVDADVVFHTGICLLNTRTGGVQLAVESFTVGFRHLDAPAIERYVAAEQPFDCLGGFKAEGLGVTLFRWMRGDDPTTLIGLPLIRLVTMLAAEGVPVP